MNLCERDRIEILIARGCGNLTRSYEEAAKFFNDSHPDRPPISKSTVQKTVQRFRDTGSVKDRPRSGRSKSATTNDKSLEVMQTFVENPHFSVRKAAQAVGIGTMSVHRVLGREKWHPFKIHFTQELKEDDCDRRVEFCDKFMQSLDNDNTLLNRIIFSDEATFDLHGAVNRHNFRYWTDENPHWMSDIRTQWPQKLNVWAGFCEKGIVGPFFIEGNLNGNTYLELLQQQVIPAIRNLYNDDMQNVWFQQDGAAPHYATSVRQFLDETFAHRWIGRRGYVEWPPRSPDLSPLDYFFWGYLKNRVYATKPANLEELRGRIIHEVQHISRDQRLKVLGEFYLRLGQCQEVAGAQFEHMK